MQVRGKSRLAAAILLAGVALAGCGKPTQGQGGPFGGGPPEVAVTVMREERVAITTELPARTSAYLVAEVRPQVNGIIQKRLFTEGSDVKAGEVLYQIDPAPYQAAYDNAAAALTRAEANLPSLRSRAERYKELVGINAVSRQDNDDAFAALKQAEADVSIQKAALETARINLAYTRIIAPVTGRTGKSNVTVGALAAAYQGSPLTTVQQLDPIYVDAAQSSASLLQLKRSIEAGRINGAGAQQAQVRLLLEDGTPYPLAGSLKFSDITVDPSTGSFILRMVFPNPKHTLLPGMYVRALIQEGVIEHAVLAPQQGISRDAKGKPLALVVDGKGQVQVRPVALDRALGDKWLVSSGLAAGDRLIVEGVQKVRPGIPVKIVPFGRGPAGPAGGPKAQAAPARAS